MNANQIENPVTTTDQLKYVVTKTVDQNIPTVRPRNRCCPYDFDSSLCKTVGDRLLCGYNMNRGHPYNSHGTLHLNDGCRLRGGRLECESLFQGFSIKKEFDVSLKPFVWKPISFIKEKFSPFGRFGVRHGIQKRELNAVAPAPVIEHDLHVEPPASIGPFLTPVPVVKPDDVLSPELIITPKPLLDQKPSSLPLSSIIPSGYTAVTPFRPGALFTIPPFIPNNSSPSSAVLVTPIPTFRPVSQSTPISLLTPQVVSLKPIINQTTLITQSDLPAASIVQSLLPVSTPPVGTPRPFNFLFDTSVPLSMPPSNFGVGNLLNLNPGISEVSQIQVSTPLTNAEQLPGLLPDRAPLNTVSTAIPIVSSVVPNEVLHQRVLGEGTQSSGLLTDIGKADLINNYLNAVNRQPILSKPEVKDMPPISSNSIVPETPSDSIFDNSALMRGTRLALHFSNIFVQLMSQFFSNARLTLSQLPELRLRE
ncbi:hypothetical protein K1T71_010230 [Dendrolimus kikuchii]|uniref:Uncharacterized protein n=1 Tax=Dendrolimus kikuchii TaxID=765133 RepID=A0ACC1CRQ4_9NEOP|nr:hypothetical protein K1T71_010230 [Dendrolimus kikuchii]